MATNNDGRLEFKATLDDKELQDKLKNIEGGINDVTRVSNNSTKEIENNVKKQSTAFGRLGGVIGNLGGILKQVIGAFGIIAGAQAFFSLINNGIQSVIRFDKSMVNLAAIAGKTRSELRDLENDIRKVAASSISTANEVANMATELIKLGTTPEGVSALLKPTNDLSIGMQAAAADVAVLLKSTLNAFNESETAAQRYADVMAMAANKTALGFSEIKEAFTYLAPAANAMGYSVEQAASMIGVLVDNGIQASSAGRIMSTMFGRLAKQGVSLESQLEKIANSTDQMKTAALLFGAEGSRLAVVLANNTDKVKELTKEFQNAEGSLSKLTGAQLESLSSKIDVLGAAWEEFVFSVENGEGVLARMLKGFITFLTEALNGLALLSKSMDQIKGERLAGLGQAESDRITELTNNYIAQRKRRLEAEGKAYSEEEQMRDKLEKRDELIAWKQEKNVKRLIEITARLNEMDRKRDSGNREEILKLQKEAQALEAGNKALDKLIKESVEVSKGTTTGGGKDLNEEVLKKRLELLNQINNIEREINDEVLSGRELALSKIQRKYADLIEKTKELGMSESKIRELQAKETEIVSYKQDTEALKESLAEQKKLYDEFESYKLKVGEDRAKEMYSNLIDVSKNYYDTISDELDKIDVKDMSAKERDRYSVLLGLLDSYVSESDKKERERLQSLIEETRTTEEVITKLKREYEQKRLDISNEFSGKEQENRLNELEKTYSNDISNLFNEFLNEEGFASKITKAVTSATKESIFAQIQSLRGFLNTADNLTKEQIKSVMLNINELEDKMSGATSGSGNSSRLSLLNNQIQQLKEARNELTEAIKEAGDKFGKEAGVEIEKLEGLIKGIDAQLDGLGGEKAMAIAEVFGDLSSSFSNISNDFKGINEGAAKMFSLMSRISGLASQVNSSFGSMKNHVNAVSNGTADFSTAMSAGAGYLGTFMSVVGMIDGALQKSRANQARRDEERRLAQEKYFLGEMKWQREMSQMEIERIRRETIGIKGKREELEKMYSRAIEDQENLNKLSDIIFDPNKVIQSGFIGGVGGYYEEWTNASVDKIIKDLQDNIAEYENSQDKHMQKEVSKWRNQLKYWTEDVALVGKSWQELSKMLEKGLVPRDLEAYVEQFVELNKQIEEAGYNVNDLKQAMYELVTGTSFESLADEFSRFLLNGEDAVFGFGESMEDTLKKAVVSAFKNEFIVEQMKPLFDMMGEMGLEGGGFSQSEIDEIRKKAKEISEVLQTQWDQLTSGLDINFGDQLGGSARDSVKRITETQADRLIGLMNGLQMATNIQTDEVKKLYNVSLLYSEIGKEQLKELTAIRINTERTANNTDNLGEINTNIRILANGNTEQNLALGQIN